MQENRKLPLRAGCARGPGFCLVGGVPPGGLVGAQAQLFPIFGKPPGGSAWVGGTGSGVGKNMGFYRGQKANVFHFPPLSPHQKLSKIHVPSH